MIQHSTHVRIPRRWASVPWLAIVVIIVAAGCSKGDPNLSEVSGTVTVDGQPAKEGDITFIPADGKGRTAGSPITAGKYTAKVGVGTMKVEIRVPKTVGTRKLYNTADSETRNLMEESLPAKYNTQTELTLDVKAGGMEDQNYDLKTTE
jgi:hypothetical protein